MVLLSRLDARHATLYAGVYMLVLGVGLGLIMQVLVLAVQNAVAYEDLGVATSGATLFRSIGGSLGTAVLGAIFADRLTDELAGLARRRARRAGRARRAPPAAGRGPRRATRRVHRLVGHRVPRRARRRRVAFVLTWLLQERPLRETVETAGSARRSRPPGGTRCASWRASSPARRPRAHAARSSSAPSTRRRRPSARRAGCSRGWIVRDRPRAGLLMGTSPTPGGWLHSCREIAEPGQPASAASWPSAIVKRPS